MSSRSSRPGAPCSRRIATTMRVTDSRVPTSRAAYAAPQAPGLLGSGGRVPAKAAKTR